LLFGAMSFAVWRDVVCYVARNRLLFGAMSFAVWRGQFWLALHPVFVGSAVEGEGSHGQS